MSVGHFLDYSLMQRALSTVGRAIPQQVGLGYAEKTAEYEPMGKPVSSVSP